MSNMTNLKAAADVAAVTHQQGWSQSTYLRVLCDYITSSQQWANVLAYVQERAAEENSSDVSAGGSGG